MQIGYGFKPFWFWNGEMTDAEILRQIREMHDKGVDGFFIHPRQGLTVPYLSHEWFEKVKVAVETAKELNMEVWLYDEYTYPSGAAGGRVMIERPELMARYLDITTNDVAGGEKISLNYKWGKVLNVCACKLVDGKPDWTSRIDLSEYVGSMYPGVAYQDSGLTFYNKKRFFSEGCEWNITWQVPEGQWRIYMAMEMEMTNFKYFGTFIDPVNPEAIKLFIEWTHEKYKKYLGHEFGKTIKGIFTDETAIWGYHSSKPWSAIMPKIFMEKNGYDILPLLPMLHDDFGGETAKVRKDFFQTITDAFIESYDVQLNRWCEENGILYTGEKPILRISHLKHSHIPGIDAGHAKAGDMLPITWRQAYRSMPKVASSAAHFYGNELAMVEAFHSMGWDATLQDLKYNIDIFAITGVNIIVPHAYFYSTDGLRKHDAPPSCFFQIPQWKYMGLLSDHMQATQAFLKGNRVADVLVLDQSTGFWTMGPNRDKKQEYSDAFCELQEKLLLNMKDFYIIDTELLCESKIADKQIHVNDEPFKVLIVPPMDYMDDSTAAFITQFDKAGGAVLHLTAENVDYIVEQTCNVAPPCILFGGSDKMLACVYQDGDTQNIFALNTDGNPVDVLLCTQDGARLNLHFHGFETKCIQYSNGTIFVPVECGAELPLPLDGIWAMKPLGKNALRINEWTLTLPDDSECKVESKPIINQLMDAQVPFVPEFSQGFGTAPKMHSPEMQLLYTAEFDVTHKTDLWLVLEPEGILGEHKIYVNNCRQENFEVKHFYADTNLAVNITDSVHEGKNFVFVWVEATDNSHGVVNPLYIFGDFGVKDNTIVAPATTGVPVKYVDNLLPYYAGEVTYTTTIDVEEGTVLTLPASMGLAATLKVRGQELGAKVHSPYAWEVPKGVSGKVEAELTITTGISGLFEGEYVEPVTHEIVKI